MASVMVRDAAGKLARGVEGRLACPWCHARVTVREDEIHCVRSGCEFTGSITGGVPIMRGQRNRSFFDDKHAVMEHGSASPG